MSFSKQIAQFSVKAQKRITGVRRGVVLKLFNSVILDTPVLTGRCRANWKCTLGEPVLTTSEATDPSGSTALAAVQKAALTGSVDVPVFLSNSLPYAHKLEYGYSKKAPEGMVRRNVARFQRLIKVEVSK